jgi:hypothetical protein
MGRGQIELDERGKRDGKLHITCPFEDEHSTPTGGGTFVVNAADTKRAEGFAIYCSHNACRCHADHGRDRLEYLARMLEQGTLVVEDLPGLDAETLDWVEQPASPAVAEKKKLYAIPFSECTVDFDQVPLIESWLDQGTLAVMYGDSNAGKTFVALDMAFHIAAGRPWMGCDVEQGDVVYVAAESGLSVQKRIMALRLRHGIVGDVPLWVVPCPVDLLDPEADTQGLIDLVRETTGGRARLVVIDTLSRAMAGGNENASEDMSSFVRNCDRIRVAVGATVLIVHHNGKDASKGARGHSSLRAATDTELEIRDGLILATKQRDGEMRKPLAFGLEVVELGVNARGKMMTSCVVTAGNVASKTLPVLTPRMQLVRAAFMAALAGRTSVTMAEWCDAALSLPCEEFPREAWLPARKSDARHAVKVAVEQLGRFGIIVSLQEDKFILGAEDNDKQT